MKRRTLLALAIALASTGGMAHNLRDVAYTERAVWLEKMLEMCSPIYENLSQDRLKSTMPVEVYTGKRRDEVTHLEALGRSFAGIAPWLNLPSDETKEGRLRAKWQKMAVQAISNATNPGCKDHLSFVNDQRQPLVDAAYLAEGLLRSRQQLWPMFTPEEQQRIIQHLKATRSIGCGSNNWQWFSAMIEAALLDLTGTCDMGPIRNAVQNFNLYYKGDGWYGDGQDLHIDYYNSFVILPMMLDVSLALHRHGIEVPGYASVTARYRRMAGQQEMLIAADGSFPPTGRSITYRTGAFHLLAQSALLDMLPKELEPAQVRCALGAVIGKTLTKRIYDKNGWLVLGLSGHQPKLAEKYISTGSLYMATLVFLPLGLPETSPFWNGERTPWTQKKVWSGDNSVSADHALRDYAKTRQPSIHEIIDKGLAVSAAHCKAMAAKMMEKPTLLPRTYGPKFRHCAPSNWVSGFFPGSLWYLYEATGDSLFRLYADNYTRRLDSVQYQTDTHDLGFMLFCSYGNGLRLTGNAHYRNVLRQGAKSLATRFNAPSGCIRSWGSKPSAQFPVIIDNMMNLEMLMWASQYDKRYADMANSHARQTMRNHFRQDNSCFHVVEYGTHDGKVKVRRTHQGLADSSAWARGQAWALYGFTMMYRETSDTAYLNMAKAVAGYLLSTPKLCIDGIPYWDMDDSVRPTPRDASAAAVMASAFIELSGYVKPSLRKECLAMAVRQLRTLTSEEYLAEPGTNGDFILKHSVGNKPKGSEVDVPLTYADYYYIEALVRMRKLLLNGGLEWTNVQF